jgi:hypothetical protein
LWVWYKACGKTYGTKALTDVVTDRLGTTLGGGEVGREEEGKGVVGELHVCGVLLLLRVRLIGLFVVMFLADML